MTFFPCGVTTAPAVALPAVTISDRSNVRTSGSAQSTLKRTAMLLAMGGSAASFGATKVLRRVRTGDGSGLGRGLELFCPPPAPSPLNELRVFVVFGTLMTSTDMVTFLSKSVTPLTPESVTLKSSSCAQCTPSSSISSRAKRISLGYRRCKMLLMAGDGSCSSAIEPSESKEATE